MQVENVVRQRFRCGVSILERILERFPGYAHDEQQLWATLRSWFDRIGVHAWARWVANRKLWRLPFRALQTLGKWLRKDYDAKVLPRLGDLARKKVELVEGARRAAREVEERAVDKHEAELKAAKARLEKPKPIVDVVTIYPHGAVGLEPEAPREMTIHMTVRDRIRDSKLAATFERWFSKATPERQDEATLRALEHASFTRDHALTKAS